VLSPETAVVTAQAQRTSVACRCRWKFYAKAPAQFVLPNVAYTAPVVEEPQLVTVHLRDEGKAEPGCPDQVPVGKLHSNRPEKEAFVDPQDAVRPSRRA
jgi:hypothetical protein